MEKGYLGRNHAALAVVLGMRTTLNGIGTHGANVGRMEPASIQSKANGRSGAKLLGLSKSVLLEVLAFLRLSGERCPPPRIFNFRGLCLLHPPASLVTLYCPFHTQALM